MRARKLALAAIIGASQIAAAAPSSESVQAARVMRDRFYRCAQNLVADYDDRVSPVHVVAKAVAAKCQTEALNWLNAMLNAMNRTEATEAFNEVMRGEDGNLLAIVLRNRVLKSTPPPVSQKSGTPQDAAKRLK
jgi:hypothetical protein